MLDDPDVSFRTDAVLYQDFLVRCRIARVAGAPLALSAFRRKFALARAGIDPQTAGDDMWQPAMDLAASLPDDVQGVFIVVTRAAIERAPCPSDATLARAYGTHSPRRARRLLTYFEERGLIVIRTDFTGKRIVALPDLGCETLGGDPDGPDTRQAA
jgi:uncharacterized protein